jgi:hypothetical protein
VNRGSYFGIWVRKKKLIKPRKLEKKNWNNRTVKKKSKPNWIGFFTIWFF